MDRLRTDGGLRRGIRVRETRRADLAGGYLIDGFPSMGLSSAIATESMVHTSDFEAVGIIDSDVFPPLSVVRDGVPVHPARVFANESLRIGIFLSYLAPGQQLQAAAARAMLRWAADHRIGLIVSSAATKSPGGETAAIGSTESARKRASDAGLRLLDHGTVPGIPGVLLNEGAQSGQDVIVLVFHTDGSGPDYESGAELCMAISRLIPGASCNIESLRGEARRAESVIREAEEESRHMRGSMYG